MPAASLKHRKITFRIPDVRALKKVLGPVRWASDLQKKEQCAAKVINGIDPAQPSAAKPGQITHLSHGAYWLAPKSIGMTQGSGSDFGLTSFRT